MTGPPYEVHPYSIGELERLLSEKSRADAFAVSRKAHRTYFEGYFASIGAQTIVAENRYVDGDFLDDFAEYYVRCFETYKRTCVRLHFFAMPFTEEEFACYLRGTGGNLTGDNLKSAYLGFIVVKPLPQTIIGRTCLRTYPTSVGGRQFPITRQYEAHLFGLRLTVDTLAFQEQDRVAAACATSALWAVFQGTGMLFHHPIPSPVEITKAATRQAPLDTRTLPETHGLTVEQMAHAIRSVSLEPYAVSVDEEYVLKSTLYAYLRGRVPVLLGIQLAAEKDPLAAPIGASHVLAGGHAVAATGYNLGLPSAQPFDATGFLLRASRIDKIYAHDDQVGPFARMVADGVRVLLDRGGPSLFSLSTSFGASGGVETHRAIPTVALVPLYHKIRIPFERVHDIIVFFDTFIEVLRQQIPPVGEVLLPSRLEWDIYLTTVNDFKGSILHMPALANNLRLEVLEADMPRYLWRATAYCDDDLVLDLLFDATDIEQGTFFLRAVEYHGQFAALLRSISKEPTLAEWLRAGPYWPIIAWFQERP
jgi:hypothetical protein